MCEENDTRILPGRDTNPSGPWRKWGKTVCPLSWEYILLEPWISELLICVPDTASQCLWKIYFHLPLGRELSSHLGVLFYVFEMAIFLDKQGERRLLTEWFYKGRVTSVTDLRFNYLRWIHYNSIHLETKCHFSWPNKWSVITEST